MSGNFSRATKLFVGNIPWYVSTSELLHYFRQFGPVKDINILFDKKTGFSKTYGFVVFQKPETLNVVQKVDQHKLKGNVLALSFTEGQVAKARVERDIAELGHYRAEYSASSNNKGDVGKD